MFQFRAVHDCCLFIVILCVLGCLNAAVTCCACACILVWFGVLSSACVGLSFAEVRWMFTDVRCMCLPCWSCKLWYDTWTLNKRRSAYFQEIAKFTPSHGHTVIRKHHQGKRRCSRAHCSARLWRKWSALNALKRCVHDQSYGVNLPNCAISRQCTVSSLQLNSFDTIGQISASRVFGRHGLWPAFVVVTVRPFGIGLAANGIALDFDESAGVNVHGPALKSTLKLPGSSSCCMLCATWSCFINLFLKFCWFTLHLLAAVYKVGTAVLGLFCWSTSGA